MARSGHRKYEKYGEILETLNRCGISKLREYVTSKKNPVKNFDRDIEIIRYIFRGKGALVPTHFNMSRQYANQLLFRYYDYALMALNEESSGGVDGRTSDVCKVNH